MKRLKEFNFKKRLPYYLFFSIAVGLIFGLLTLTDSNVSIWIAIPIGLFSAFVGGNIFYYIFVEKELYVTAWWRSLKYLVIFFVICMILGIATYDGN